MRDYMERFESVGRKVLMRYILILVGLSSVLVLLLVLTTIFPGLDVNQALLVHAMVMSLIILSSSIVVLMAFKRILAATLVIVLREITQAMRSSGSEEILVPVKTQKGGQAAEAATPQIPTRVVKSPERVEKKPVATAVTAEKKCPYCGRTLPFGDIHTICPFCGRRIR